MKNLFCSQRDLKNEATVEALFIDRFLQLLGYDDNKIKRKESIDEIVIGRGSSKEKYKPDYVLLDSRNKPIIIIDAKSPKINDIKKYYYQISSYALALNQKYCDENPVLYTILTNGQFFIVYSWDNNQALFYLRFEDFTYNNEKFLEIRSNLSYHAFKQVAATEGVFEFRRPDLNKLLKTFNDCHNLIWKKEKINPTDAFYEFSKIMFIKIREDNKIHNIIESGNNPQKKDFIFSTNWIDEQSKVEPHPVNSILFRQIQEELERQIRDNKKKRIFEKNEGLALKATTTYEVVKKLQHFDLYGIDEDLNGRMFETFLNATVRGKGLGQFFTPRGVVHYMVETSPIYISLDKSLPISERMPFIMDGCCGSGGFLIDAMSQFIRRININSYLSQTEKQHYLEEIKNNHLYGIDANSKIAKISRLNMYLHGDGGSKIFQADTLDKDLSIELGITEEEKEGLIELKKLLIEEKNKFDIILTNPPFSMKYNSNDKHEERILNQYDIAKSPTNNVSSTEKSNVLFLERYHDLLKPNSGELLTIIDDTVLNGEKSQKYRDFILENFNIIQIISLPFNTFFRAEANIKTSIIHLRRKKNNEKQGSIFMAITNNIGHDDHSNDTPDRNNLPLTAKYFDMWKNGENFEDQIIYNENIDESLSCPLQIFIVKPENLYISRLDAFYYSPELKNIKNLLNNKNDKGEIIIKKGSDFNIIKETKKDEEKQYYGNIFKYFEIGDVTIDGTIVKHRIDNFENLPTRARLFVQAGDVIFAKNNSSRGTTVIIPKWFDNNFVTTGFIGIRPNNEEEALLLWNIFESELFRKQIYYLSITASQPEVRHTIFKNEILIPWPVDDSLKEKILNNVKKIETARGNLTDALINAKEEINKLIEIN